MDIVRAFTQIGFTGFHARIYSALLESGILTMQAISRVTKIPRSSCYEYLPGLIDAGLIEEIIDGKSRQYKAANPEKFISWHQTKLAEFQFEHERLNAIKPDLLSRFEDQQDRLWSTQFKGAKQIGLMLAKLLESDTELLLIDCFNLENNLGFKFEERFYKNLPLALRNKHLNSRELIPSSRAGQIYYEFNTNKQQNIKIYNPEIFKSAIKKIIWNDSVMYLSMRENKGIIIRHESIADIERKLFDNLWALQLN